MSSSYRLKYCAIPFKKHTWSCDRVCKLTRLIPKLFTIPIPHNLQITWVARLDGLHHRHKCSQFCEHSEAVKFRRATWLERHHHNYSTAQQNQMYHQVMLTHIRHPISPRYHLTDLYTFITARIFSTWLLYYSYYRQLQFAFGNWNATALDIALCIYWFAYSSSLRVSISRHMSHRVDPSSSHRKYNLWRNTDLKQSLRLLYHRIRRSNCQSWKSSSFSETFASQNTALWIAIR